MRIDRFQLQHAQTQFRDDLEIVVTGAQRSEQVVVQVGCVSELSLFQGVCAVRTDLQ